MMVCNNVPEWLTNFLILILSSAIANIPGPACRHRKGEYDDVFVQQ